MIVLCIPSIVVIDYVWRDRWIAQPSIDCMIDRWWWSEYVGVGRALALTVIIDPNPNSNNRN